jgi:hypothetical protein
MRILRKFAGYSALERRLVVKAWFAVAAVRILLWVVPYRVIERWLLTPPATTRGVPPADVAVSVTRAATLVPFATCLVQAIAGGWLIGREGGTSVIRFGVAKDSDTSAFKAHAWLEHEGRILIGGGTAGEYSTLVHARNGHR